MPILHQKQTTIRTYSFLLNSQTVLVGPLSVIQPFSHTLALTSPDHWPTLGNQRLNLPGETISLRFCVQLTYGTHQTSPSQGIISNSGRMEPRRFISCDQKNSRSVSVGFEPGASRFAVELHISWSYHLSQFSAKINMAFQSVQMFYQLNLLCYLFHYFEIFFSLHSPIFQIILVIAVIHNAHLF